MTAALTLTALLAFAANSLLARAALGAGAIDATSFTAIRLCAGAIVLAMLLVARRGALPRWLPGNRLSAAALFAYAIGFSAAYQRLGAATGTLILFACVQATMLSWNTIKGDRLGRRERAGLGVAFAAFVALLLPGLSAPDPIGSLMMAGAGVAWGIYTLRGRTEVSPLEATAGNFLRAAPFSVLLLALAHHTASGAGITLAVLSGALASGLGYVVWYLALPRLRPVQAASVQLTVPLIAALGAVAILSEPLTARLVIAGSCLLAGVGVALLAKPRDAS